MENPATRWGWSHGTNPSMGRPPSAGQARPKRRRMARRKRSNRMSMECLAWGQVNRQLHSASETPPLRTTARGGYLPYFTCCFTFVDLGTRGLTLWKLTDVDVRGLTPLEKYAREGRQTRGRRSEHRQTREPGRRRRTGHRHRPHMRRRHRGV